MHDVAVYVIVIVGMLVALLVALGCDGKDHRK